MEMQLDTQKIVSWWKCDLYGNGEISQNFQINCTYTCWFPSFPAKVLSGPNTKKKQTHHQSIRSYWFLNLAPVVCFNPFSSSSGQIFTEWFDLRQGENWKRGGGSQAMLWYQIISNLPYLKYQSIPKHHWNSMDLLLFFKNFCLCMHSRWSSILQGLVRIEIHGGFFSAKCCKCPDSQSPDRSPSIAPRVQQHNFLPTCGTNVPHTTGGFGVRGMPWWSANLHNLPQEQEPKLARWLWLNWNQNINC